MVCENPFLDFSQLTPSELRRIGLACSNDGVKDLYLNRAYHLELLIELKAVTHLESLRGERKTRHYHTQRILLGLSEAMAYGAWKQGQSSIILSLNRSYDEAIEIAEYQLRGNDLLVRTEHTDVDQ